MKFLKTDTGVLIPYKKIVRVHTQGNYLYDILGSMHRAEHVEIDNFINYNNSDK